MSSKPIRLLVKKKLFYTLCFLPMEYLTYSVNFIYLLLFFRLKYRRINDGILSFFLIYVLISYFIGLLFLIPWDPHSLLRQFVSFATFSSGLFLLFIKFDKAAFEDLIAASITASALYSLWVVFIFVTHSSEFSIQEIYITKMQFREYVWDWPQTYVPMLVFAFITGFSRRKINKRYLPLMLLFPAVIFVTFTRSAYLALFAGFISYFLFTIQKIKIRLPINECIKYALTILIGIFLVCILLQHEGISQALNEMVRRSFYALYNFITHSVPDIGSDEERTAIMQTSFTTAKEYFVSGTGFGGIYLFWDNIGSTHNQYLDTLLKMGLIGLLSMIYVFFKLIRYFYVHDKGVLSGILALLVYGLFNAVYQQPYLIFLVFSLLSYVDGQEINFFSFKGEPEFKEQRKSGNYQVSNL